MGLLKFIVPAVILKKVYKKNYVGPVKTKTDEENDAVSDAKDDK